MSLTPDPTAHVTHTETIVETSTTPRWVSILFVIAFIIVGYLLYAGYSDREYVHSQFDTANRQAQALGAELDKTNSRIADLKGQLEVTTQKLGLTENELARARTLAQQISAQQKASDEQLRSQIGQVQQDTSAKFGEVDTAITGTKGDVAATRKDLDDTKAKLVSTVGDLGVQSGLIAKNHDEVEELKRLGERNIYEFNITKEKKPQKVGPVQVSLRKTDPKHFTYTLDVIADDKNIEKKDRSAGEPIQFYVRGARAPYEVVVFDVNKNRISGYLSTPKDNTAPAPSAAASQQ